MPKATLSMRRALELLPAPPSRAELGEILFRSKAELVGGEGDALELEATPDRLDLLCEGGLGVYLQGVLGTAQGIPATAPLRETGFSIEVERSVAPLRGSIAGVIVEPPDGGSLGAELLDEAVRFQELLHATVGLNRKLASLGIYALARLRGAIRYALEPMSSVRFTQLDRTESTDGATFFATHPMAAKYGAYARTGDRCLVLRDAAGTILSLPPVLNGREAGEARPGDGALLLESTGTRPGRVADSLGLLTLVFVARGWRAGSVRVVGSSRPAKTGDPLRLHPLRLSRGVLRALGGIEIAPEEVDGLLGHARLDVRRDSRGWQVEVPPWRPDLHAPADLVEEVVLARGVRAEDGIVPPARTRGGRTPAAGFRDRVAGRLLGLSIVPVYTPVLVAERHVQLAERTQAIALENPVSEEYARMRDRLLLSHLAVLEHNVRHGYPQRFGEVGPVVVPDPSSESGAATRYHAGVLLAGDSGGFADAAALVDYVTRSFGTTGVREPAELPGTIPGRAAVVRLAGEVIAEVAELAPSVLTELRVPVPVAWAELDVTALAPLLAPPRPSSDPARR